MYLLVFLIGSLICGTHGDLSEPKFQVLTPDELMVQVPHFEGAKLVTFRIGVKRKDYETEDLELGENDINNSRIFIYDQRLNLQKGDTVNYLLAFRNNEGYQALTGKYVFDGAYYKKPFGRRHRFRRHLSSTTEKAEFNVYETTETFNPVESRFGFHIHHHPHQGNWRDHGPPTDGFNPYGPPTNGFNPFGPPRGYPNYPNHPPPFAPPNCNDHRHDLCHENPDSERWQSGSTVTPTIDVKYHCKICRTYSDKGDETTLRTTSTTSEVFPDIDIRSSD